MKHYDFWSDFTRTGKVDDYLNYIACTREESMEDHYSVVDRKEEGEYHAGINHRDGNGPISHAGWGL